MRVGTTVATRPAARLKPESGARKRPDVTPGRVTLPPGRIDRHAVSLLAPMSYAAAQYRVLAHRLRRDLPRVRVLGISSAGVGDGKTTTSINLAGALAEEIPGGVLLVDADLRRSAVAARLGLARKDPPGLAELLHPSPPLVDRVVLRLEPFSFDLLPAGESPPDPFGRLRKGNLRRLLERLRSRYEWIVLDTPPLLPVPDHRLISEAVDSFLIVVAAHRTPRDMLETGLDALGQDRVSGIIFNGDDQPMNRYRRHYRSYYTELHRTGGPSGGR